MAKPFNNPNNRKQSSSSQKLKLSSIVERLPLLRFLDESRAVLLKLQPNWLAWRSENLPNLCESAAHLSGFDNDTGQITVSVNNASTAALIKHQKISLLEMLQRAAKARHMPHSIKRIKVRVNLESTSAAAELLQRLNNEPAEQNDHYTTQSFNSAAIKSIKNLESQVKNPELAATLGELASTLSEFSNKKTDK